ncbi:MAG: 4Fe-4S binding protein [Promethearchaeota archaeon]|jgi:ferredoxin
MKINKVKLLTFSPTGNSTKIAKTIAEELNAPIEHIDLTPPSSKSQDFEEFNTELTIVASPVYLGRIPFEAAHRIRRLKANNTPTALIVTYGNRAYEDALRELADIVQEVGFNPIAAGAFIGEHSMSEPETPTAHGRPDEKDLAIAKEFAIKIKEKIDSVANIKALSSFKTPGKNPYTLRATLYHVTELMGPRTNEDICTLCGKCVEVCPTSAIKIKHLIAHLSPRASLDTFKVYTDEEACLWCCACVRACSTSARERRPRMLRTTKSLNERLQERKEPETYL